MPRYSRRIVPELRIIRKVTSKAQVPIHRIFTAAVAKVRGRPRWRVVKNPAAGQQKALEFRRLSDEDLYSLAVEIGDPRFIAESRFRLATPLASRPTQKLMLPPERKDSPIQQDPATGLWQVQVGAITGGEINLDRLAAAVASGNVSAIEATLRMDTLAGALNLDLSSLVWKVIANAGGAANDTFAEAFGINAISMDGFRAAAIEASQGLVGDLVTAVQDGERQAIRDLLQAGFEDGSSPSAIASDIAGSVGLDARSASGFQDFIDAIQANPPDLDQAGIQALIDGEYARRLDYRAIRIAQTESVRAATQAQKGLYQQAFDEGQLNQDDWAFVFVANPDACEICDAADGSDEEAPAHSFCECGNQLRKVA